MHPAPEPLQLIPGGLLTTVPVPAPTRYTLSEGRLDPPEPGFTLRLEVPIISEPSCAVALAVMVVMQGFGGVQATAVPKPDELTVAISTSLDAQVTVSVISTVIGPAVNVPIAMNCAVSPSAFKICVPGPGMMVIADRVRCWVAEPGLTVSVAAPIMVEPDNDVALAVIVAAQLELPHPTAVAKPEELTVAISVALDAQVTWPARFSVVGGAL